MEASCRAAGCRRVESRPHVPPPIPSKSGPHPLYTYHRPRLPGLDPTDDSMENEVKIAEDAKAVIRICFGDANLVCLFSDFKGDAKFGLQRGTSDEIKGFLPGSLKVLVEINGICSEELEFGSLSTNPRAQSNYDNGTVPDVRDGPTRTSPSLKNLDGEHVRLFVDAAFKDNACKYGVVVLDARGQFIEAAAGSMYLGSPLEAECFAVLKALKLLAMRTYTAAVLYSDSLLTVQYWHSSSKSWPWSLHGSLSRVLNMWNTTNYVDIHHIS